MSADLRPDRHALLELDALLGEIRSLREEGDATRFAADPRYRWVLHRLWTVKSTFSKALQHWIADCNIHDETGNLVLVSAHQFRLRAERIAPSKTPSTT